MTETTTGDRIDPTVIKAAGVLIVGALAVVFDTTIISVALRTLSVQLHVPVSTIQWVSTGYLLALGVAIPLAGWAQARFGGKRVWMFALTIFLAGSILCSLSWSADSLIAFRIVEGLGGGLMLPLFSTMIMQAAAGRALGRTMSYVTLPTVVGPILGPVIGGAILRWLDWRWLFWVNVPFCVAGFILAWRMLDPDATSARPRVDIVGWLLLSPSLVAILLGLSNSAQEGGFGRADAFGPLLAGTVLAGDIRPVFSSPGRQRAGRRQIVRAPATRVRIRPDVPVRRRALRRHAAAAALLAGCARSGRAPGRPAACSPGHRRAPEPHRWPGGSPTESGPGGSRSPASRSSDSRPCRSRWPPRRPASGS